jgi:hypothetical protein
VSRASECERRDQDDVQQEELMQIKNEFTVIVPLEHAWAALADLAAVVVLIVR